MKSLGHQKTQSGFTLVELLIAMVLGLAVLGGTLSAFVSTMKSTQLNQALSQLQSNSMFAVQAISNDLRMAGYLGCASGAGTDNLIVSTDPSPTDDFSVTSVRAAVVNAADWAPAKPANYTAPAATGAPVTGTHVLMVQYALAPGNRLYDSMTGRDSAINVVGDNVDLTSGNYAVISNCNNGELFSIDSSGNSTDGLSITPEQGLSQAYLHNDKVPESVRVMPFKSVMYYIGSTSRVNKSGDPINSLFMQTFPYDLASNPPLEIIEGVEQLQLNMGVASGDGYTFHSPDSPTLDFSEVGLVKVGLLFSTRERHSDNAANRPYYLADTLVTAGTQGTGVSYPDDDRIRIAHNMSVKIRNRSD